MASLEISPSEFKGIYWNANDPALPAKLGQIVLRGPKEWHGVIDFDECMSTPDSWRVTCDLASKPAQDRYQEYNDEYYTAHKKGLLRDEEAMEWWQKVFRSFVDDKIKLADIERDAGQKMAARPGLVGYISLLKQLEVPTFILSGGIGNTIKPFLKRHGLDAENDFADIMANWFTADPDGYIEMPDISTIIHMNSKRESSQGNGKLTRTREERPLVLSTGDGSKDPLMAEGELVLNTRVGLYVPKNLTPEEKSKLLAESYEQGYDGVSADGTFMPIEETTRKFIQLSIAATA